MITWQDRKMQYDRYYFTEYGNYVSVQGEPTCPTGNAVEFARALYGLFHPSSVLDCGCATGWLIHGFLHLDSSIEARGVDVSQFAVDHCFADVRDKISVCDISVDLPFPSKAFDLVTAIDVLEHLQDYSAIRHAVEEICRVCRSIVFLRQPMMRFIGFETNSEISIYLQALNALPHKARLGLLGIDDRVAHTRPIPHQIEHPNENPRALWVGLFESQGFQEIALPEYAYIFPNCLTVHSFNTVVFKREGS